MGTDKGARELGPFVLGELALCTLSFTCTLSFCGCLSCRQAVLAWIRAHPHVHNHTFFKLRDSTLYSLCLRSTALGPVRTNTDRYSEVYEAPDYACWSHISEPHRCPRVSGWAHPYISLRVLFTSPVSAIKGLAGLLYYLYMSFWGVYVYILWSF